MQTDRSLAEPWKVVGVPVCESREVSHGSRVRRPVGRLRALLAEIEQGGPPHCGLIVEELAGRPTSRHGCPVKSPGRRGLDSGPPFFLPKNKSLAARVN